MVNNFDYWYLRLSNTIFYLFAEFFKTKELVDTQSNVEVAVPVVEVSDKTISLLIESLHISKDYAENIIEFRKTHNLSNKDMVLLNWCRENG
jgi:hypothetical protein